MSSTAGNESSLVRLEWSIRALAQEADVQAELYPSYVCVADELAIEFVECLESAMDVTCELSEEAVDLIMDRDRKLASMSGPTNAEFWTDDALNKSPEWIDVRALAREIIQAASWTSDAPPAARATYVGPDAGQLSSNELSSFFRSSAAAGLKVTLPLPAMSHHQRLKATGACSGNSSIQEVERPR